MASEDESAQPDALADFEKSLAELEQLVEALESGDIGLQDALAKFERGVTLARSCQEALRTAELRVEQLTEQNGQASVSELDPPGDDPA